LLPKDYETWEILAGDDLTQNHQSHWDEVIDSGIWKSIGEPPSTEKEYMDMVVDEWKRLNPFYPRNADKSSLQDFGGK